VHPNETVVRSYMGAVGDGDLDRVRAYIADDVVAHVGGRSAISGDIVGADALVRWLQDVRERLGDPVDPELHDVLATDDHVVVLVRRTIAGVPAPAVVIYHVADGKITEGWLHETRQAEVDAAIGLS
jgi:ketosteroid isomerase-like protein